MEHSTPLITILAAGFSMALAFGFIAERLKTPALVGYLIAGILIGPGSPGFTADVELGKQLSEIGVMLLMFGVGLHFSTNDLMSVKKIAVPGAITQMTISTIFGILLAKCWGWSWGASLIVGLSLSCASTVVALKALEAKDLINAIPGKITVGCLVVEDLVTVLVLVLLPPLSTLLGENAATATAAVATETKSIWLMIGETLLQVSAFIAVMLIAGRRILPWALLQVAKTGSRELFTLAVIASAIGIAYLAALLFNVSAALGAFFAGMVMRESAYSQRAAEESLPLRDAFSVLFFVSVGMLFDPKILIQQPWHVLGVIFIILICKPLIACSLILFSRYPLHTALTVSACLAQIGEFSFILAGLGISLGLLPQDGLSLILAGAVISIAINPIVFALAPTLQRWILERSAFARKL
ncbi:MAG: cation:proton antiporter, partial [Rhodocyclaceae bacterium]